MVRIFASSAGEAGAMSRSNSVCEERFPLRIGGD